MHTGFLSQARQSEQGFQWLPWPYRRLQGWFDSGFGSKELCILLEQGSWWVMNNWEVVCVFLSLNLTLRGSSMNSSPGWWKVGTQRERWGVDWYLNLVFPALVMSREKIQRPHKDLGSFIKDLKCVFKRVTVELKWGDRWGTRNRSEFSGIGVCSLLWGFCDVGWCQVHDGNTYIGLMRRCRCCDIEGSQQPAILLGRVGPSSICGCLSLQLSLRGLRFPHGTLRQGRKAEIKETWMGMLSLESHRLREFWWESRERESRPHCWWEWKPVIVEITEVSKTLELDPPCDSVIPLVYDGNEAFISTLGFPSSNLSHNLCPLYGWHHVRKVDGLLLSNLVS